MVQMDYVLGKLMDKLDEIGEAENTLVIFTSDNGPECEVPPRGRTPFRGCKGSSWEGGVRVPTFVYWKGMISPRKSDQLFDLADILPTALDLAGVPREKLAELFPKTTYIDGVDQASFLVADDGLSARRSRIYTLNQYYSAIRIDEFKGVVTGEIENGVVQRGYTGGFSGSVFTDTGGAIVFNLYTNPQEDVSIGIRHIPMAVPLGETGGWYLKELFEYPPQFKVGFMSNNPPAYDVIPEVKMGAKAWLKEHGFGRFQP
jgi:arylsulfatase